MSSISPPALNIMIPADDVPEPIETIAARAVRAAARAARSRLNDTDYDAGSASFERAQRANAQALLKGPIRIRPEPATRDLALEEQIDHEHIAHHQHRRDEEIDAIRRKFAHGRQRARIVFSNKTDKLQEKYKKSVLKLATGDKDDWELLRTLSDNHSSQQRHEAGVYQIKLECLSSARKEAKIAYITKRRAELAWICPNDGKAYPFTWEGRQYHRTYDGEMWLSENWLWAGQWTGYYITNAAEAEDAKEATHQLCRALRNW
jgi:hypothetical protein